MFINMLGNKCSVRLLLTSVLLLIFCTESAFSDATLTTGNDISASGTITIGSGTSNDFSSSSGTVVLSSLATIVSGGSDINLGDYSSSSKGAAIFTNGNTITGITLNSSNLNSSNPGTLTIYGGADDSPSSNGAVTITGTVSTATAALKIFGVSGEDVSITATSGGINMGSNDIDTRDGANDGGSITLKITNSNSSEDITTSSIYSSSGNGGDITISTAGSGSITTVNIYSYSSGNGGDITITSGSGSITTNEINSSSSSSSGNGGDITITSGSGSITTRSIQSYSKADSSSGNGGDITITADSGSIETDNISSYSKADSSSGDGGDITITADSGEINVGGIYSYSTHATGGAVKISAENGTVAGLGDIVTNSTVTITAGELTGDIGAIGDSSETYRKTGQVDITIGNVTGSSVTIGDIITNNADVNITESTSATNGNALTFRDINAGDGNITINASNMNKNSRFSTLSGNNITITGSTTGTGTLTVDNRINVLSTLKLYATTANSIVFSSGIKLFDGATLQYAGNDETISSLTVANNAAGNINVTSGTLTLNSISNYGTLNISVGKSGTFTTSGINLTASAGTITLDLGDESDPSVYATTHRTDKELRHYRGSFCLLHQRCCWNNI